MNISDANMIQIGEEVLVNGVESTVLNTIPLSSGDILFEVENRYDGILDVTSKDVELI